MGVDKSGQALWPTSSTADEAAEVFAFLGEQASRRCDPRGVGTIDVTLDKVSQ
jgi:hypothetical protein